MVLSFCWISFVTESAYDCATSSATYRLAVKPTAGTTLATNHYIAYDVPIAANDSVALTIGITLASSNAIRTYASNTNLTFTAFGSES